MLWSVVAASPLGRSHGHHRAVLVTVSGQVSRPPLGSSYCPLTRRQRQLRTDLQPPGGNGEGERAFRERERKAIRDAVSFPGRVIATGGGSFLDNENRLRLKEYAPVIFLDVSPGTALRRLSGNTTRPLLSGENREETVADLMASRRAAYMEADFRVNTEDRSPDRVAETVYTLLSRKTKTGEGGWNPGTERRRE